MKDSSIKPSLDRLKGPLEHPESIMHGFCTECNVHVELSENQVLEIAGDDMPENLQEYYMSMDMCGVCGSETTHGSLKPIPSD